MVGGSAHWMCVQRPAGCLGSFETVRIFLEARVVAEFLSSPEAGFGGRCVEMAVGSTFGIDGRKRLAELWKWM